MGMLLVVSVLLALALLGGPVGVGIAIVVLLLGGMIAAMQPSLSRDNAAYNRENAQETSTRPGPGCPCADCQAVLWTATGGADNEWVVMDSSRDGRKTSRLADRAPVKSTGGKTRRLATQSNGHPVGCTCLDCGDLRAGKSSRWA